MAVAHAGGGGSFLAGPAGAAAATPGAPASRSAVSTDPASADPAAPTHLVRVIPAD
jgi:hypothetical protein